MYSLNALISLDTVLDSRDTVLTKTDKDPALTELTCMCVRACTYVIAIGQWGDICWDVEE